MFIIDKITRFKSRNANNLLLGFYRENLALLCRKKWGRQLFRKLTNLPPEPQQWVFIVGCYNSGTTILQRVISAHPEVSSPPFEGTELTAGFPDLEYGNWPRLMYVNFNNWDCLENESGDLASTVKNDWLIWHAINKSVFLEKSIAHVAHIRWIQRNFENAKFIVLRRNGYCVNEGILRRSASQFANDPVKQAHYSSRFLAEQWLEINSWIDTRTLDWDNKLEISYESFSDAPEVVTKKIFDFIGLDSSLVRTTDNKSLQVGSAEFRIKNQNGESLARLSDEQRLDMWVVFSEKMLEYGYFEKSVYS